MRERKEEEGEEERGASQDLNLRVSSNIVRRPSAKSERVLLGVVSVSRQACGLGREEAEVMSAYVPVKM